MQIDENTIRTAVHLTSDDNKMLLLNNRYYCELTESQKTRDVEPKYCFFSCSWKEKNSPTLTQYTDCFVLDTYVEKGRHKNQYGKLYHSVHDDLNCMHTFCLMLSDDKSQITVNSIEIIDKPYPLQNLMELIDKDILPKSYAIEDGDPMLTVDGVACFDLARFGSKIVSIEYYVTGKLYVEIVDFKDVPDSGIVQLNDTTRREVLVNMPVTGDRLSDSNVADIAALINTRVKTIKKEYENDSRSRRKSS